MEKHCKKCNKQLDALLPFQCRHCNQYFCEDHRLPENHSCPNIRTSWGSWRRNQEKLQGRPSERHTTHYPSVDTRQNERKSTRRNYRRFPKIHLSNLAKIFYVSLIIFIILHLILMEISSIEIWLVYIVVLCIVEITGLLWLLFKLDRISTHSTLRLWGLKILAGIIAIFGVFFLIVIWGSSLTYFMFYPFYSKSDPTLVFLSFLPYLIPGIGLAGIGAYLEFKFRRQSGVIVYRG